MSAIEAGVDLEDDNALQAYIQEYNQRLRASFGGLPAKPSKPVVERPSNRYAPCPCGSGKKFKFCCERKD